jgi:hypothetical protein
MINVAQFRAALSSVKGDTFAIPQEQMTELLAEVERGQHARRALTNIRTMVNLAANTSGALA